MKIIRPEVSLHARPRPRLIPKKTKTTHTDMIEVFKILHNYYMVLKLPQNKSSTTLNNASVTRGNSLKLLNQSFHYDIRKYSFPARVVNICNSLLMLSWHLLLIHLKTDLIGSEVIKMLNMITLLN